MNAARQWDQFASPLLDCVPADQVLIVDSSSSDGTADLARTSGFRVEQVPRHAFNHGGTRQWAAGLVPEADILVFLTQDAVLASSQMIALLLEPFRDSAVAISYGRQLPRPGARPIEAHARLFNYPATSALHTLDSRAHLGFKSIFVSNSFAAYRRTALEAAGGFPSDVILGEDTVTAARLLLLGWKIAYVSDALVYHSHDYTIAQEFRRYFDVGVLHSRQSWLLREFGGASGEGGRFVRSELAYLMTHQPFAIPSALLRTAAKLVGYRLGRLEHHLPTGLKQTLSMHRSFWGRGGRGERD